MSFLRCHMQSRPLLYKSATAAGVMALHALQAGAGSLQHHAGQVQEGQHDQNREAAGRVCRGQGGARVHPLCDPAAHIASPD